MLHWIAEYGKRHVPFVLAMLDIDHFKRINDTLGHPVGDRVLICAAQWLTSNVRGEDFLARYGGEEFAVLLCDVRLKQAESKFATFLERVAESSYQYDEGGEKRVTQFTFSCGLAEYSSADSAESLISRADEALYQAKGNGKN
ncbi:MAG: GGDEF domain-containing protein, partial [Pyrinomonadaceae bacterium]